MKKLLITLITIIVILAIIVLTAPFVTGKIIAKRYQQFIEQVAQTKYVDIKLLNYKREWFTSNATLQITVNPQFRFTPNKTASNRPITVTIKQHITHGPLMLINTENHRKVLLGLGYVQSRIKQKQMNLETYTYIQFDGSIRYKVTAPIFIIAIPQEGRSYVFKNFNIEGNTYLNYNKTKGEMYVEDMVVRDNATLQQLTGFKADYSLDRADSGLYLGEHSIKVQKISLDDLQAKKHFEAQNLAVESDTKESNNKIDFDLNVTVGSTMINGQNIGPHHLELEASKLDERLLLALRQQIIAMQQQGFGLLQLAKYNQLLLYLLSHGAEVDLKKLEIATNMGKSTITGSFVFEPTAKETANPKELLQNLEASVSIRIPQALFNENMIKFYTWSDSHKEAGSTPAISPAQRAQTTLSMWLQSKWLLLDGDYYVSDVAYKNQTTTINGQPLVQAAPAAAAPATPTAAPSPSGTVQTQTTVTTSAPSAQSAPAPTPAPQAQPAAQNK